MRFMNKADLWGLEGQSVGTIGDTSDLPLKRHTAVCRVPF